MTLSNVAAAEENGNEDGSPAGLLQTVKPFIAAAAVIATGSVLIPAIYFTLLDLQWIAFLAGILIASILAMTAQATRAGIAAEAGARRLALADYRSAGESGQREKLEKLLADANARLRYSDEALPAMVAFVDHDTVYRYHNRAFANWLGLEDAKIDGKHMRDVLGRKVFSEVESYVFEVAAGHLVRYEKTHKSPSGALYRVAVQYLPQFGEDGKYTGFYMVITDITERRDVGLPPGALRAADPGALIRVSPPGTGNAGLQHAGDPALADASAGAADTWLDASQRILAAINGNEFTLFCQRITPLAGSASAPDHYEVLIRLLEEEDRMIPPGAFFSLAEEYGLLPQLDRWVFSHVLDWMVTPAGAVTVRTGAIYFINVAAATISDPDFPEFVEYHLRRTGAPAKSVCIEIDESDLTLSQGDSIEFARLIRQCGCLTAISGFGRRRLPMETLKLFPVDFLKIHGSIVRQIAAYPESLAKAAAICKLAKAIGVRTVAEMVEDDATLALLRTLKLDFAQGFGISRPQMLTGLRGSASDATAQLPFAAEPARVPVSQES
jgi:PAS domain S-box-containing protein